MKDSGLTYQGVPIFFDDTGDHPTIAEVTAWLLVTYKRGKPWPRRRYYGSKG